MKSTLRRLGITLCLLTAIAVGPGVGGSGSRSLQNRVHYLFTSFRGNGEDGLHLALSNDGYKWSTLNQDRSFLKPVVGKGRLMRDPCIASAPDGTFHMVWTTGWTDQTIGYAWSKDLIEWRDQKVIPVMAHEPGARNSWAPELFYDESKNTWLIFWATTIPGRFPETDQTGNNGYNHRIYYVTTKDFKTFSQTRLFFDPGFNVIDATIIKAGKRFYLVFKDERQNPVKKNLRTAIADSAAGPYGEISEPFTRDWVEGPSAIKIGNDLVGLLRSVPRPSLRRNEIERSQELAGDLRRPLVSRRPQTRVGAENLSYPGAKAQ